MAQLTLAECCDCVGKTGKTIVTLLDLRNENFLETERPFPSIKTNCRTLKCRFDDLSDPAVRNRIPREGLVVLVCETGNRGAAVMKYLYKYGYSNVVGLRYGMRSWLKLGYPIKYAK